MFVAIPQIGAVVDVTLPTITADGQETISKARVVRIDRTPSGYVVGLEFVE